MANLTGLAKKYTAAGFSVIPVGTNKIPTIWSWKDFQQRPMTPDEVDKHFKNAYGIALVCGVKGVTCIDIDLKYDLTGDLFERYKAKLPNSILKKLYVQSTQSKGIHLVFMCDFIEGNQKLANRFTTVYEKHQTYTETFHNHQTRDKALKIASNDTTRVLIETRGEGGYFLIAPSPGYKHIYGKLDTITEEEYHIILDTAREFNEVEVKKDSRYQAAAPNSDWEITPFNDYNDRADCIHLLEMNGWEVVHRGRENIRLKRPGRSSPSSANYNEDMKQLYIFSTSTSFDPNKAYSPADVFNHLECNDDIGLCYNKLIEMGYGKRKQLR